jgi:hypothetical protein
MGRWAEDPGDPAILRSVERLLAALKPLEIDIDLWKSQNLYVAGGRQAYAENVERAGRGDAVAKRWLEAFGAAGKSLRVSPVVSERS